MVRFHGFNLDYERLDADRYTAAAITDDVCAMATAIRGASRNARPDRAMRAQYQVAKESEWERQTNYRSVVALFVPTGDSF